MRIVDYGHVNDAITAGKRADARSMIDVVPDAAAKNISNMFSSSDVAIAAELKSLNSPDQFVWTTHLWGDTKYKVTE